MGARQAHGRQTAGLLTRIAAASWSPVTRAYQYRVKAGECRDQAERARVPGVREQWLRLASQWERLAKEAERQSGQFAEQPGVVALVRGRPNFAVIQMCALA